MLATQPTAAPTYTAVPQRAEHESLCPDRCGPECRGNHQFVNMLEAFQPTGGLARLPDAMQLFQRRRGPSLETVARWIARRQLISFYWREEMYLPWFQFHCVKLQPHPELVGIFEELVPVYDGWEMANWFARPNQWLSHRAPVSLLLSDLGGIRDAARAERFIATG